MSAFHDRLRSLTTACLLILVALTSAPQVTAAAGGPDDGGYQYKDSNEPDGPVYAFDDISTTGTAISLSDDDTESVSIGFSFPYYGNTYTSVWISSNGFLSLESSDNRCCTGQNLDGGNGLPGIIAGYWEDLYPPAGGSVRYQSGGGTQPFIVQFTDIQHYSGGTPTTFQFKLFDTGVIEVHYQDAPSDGGTHSAGISSPDGSTGLSYGFGSFSKNLIAVRYSNQPATPPPLLGGTSPGYVVSPDPKQGSTTLAPDGCTTDNADDQIDWIEIGSTAGPSTISVRIQWLPSSTGSYTADWGVHLKAFHFDGVTWREAYSAPYTPSGFTLDQWHIDEFTYTLPPDTAAGTSYMRASIIDRADSSDQMTGNCASSNSGTSSDSSRHFDNADVDFSVTSGGLPTTDGQAERPVAAAVTANERGAIEVIVYSEWVNTLGWTLERVDVQRAPAMDGPYQTIYSENNILIDHIDRGLPDDTEFWYRAIAYYEDGSASQPSVPVFEETLKTPEEPLHLASIPYDVGIQLTWAPPEELGNGLPYWGNLWYNVYRSDGCTGAFDPIASGLFDNVYFDNRPAGEYCYFVTAETHVAEGPASNTVQEYPLGTDQDGDDVPAHVDPDDNDPFNPLDDRPLDDDDGDGFVAAVDPDDNDPNDPVDARDQDGDGVIAEVDPDDQDPYNPVDERQLDDNDGDGFVAAADPDDSDPNDPVDKRDADGDGVPAFADPDDNDPYNPVNERQLDDNDGDGVIAAVDPDDNDPNDPVDARDQDGDGVPSGVDPDDGDPNDPIDSRDQDGDSVPAYADPDDQDPYDPVDERQLADGDGDGVVAAADPDDNDPNEPVDRRDQDGDGFIAELDGDDNDPNEPFDGRDQDSDGVIAEVDPDDQDPYNPVDERQLDDNDGDGFVAAADPDDSDPNDPVDKRDADGDGVPAFADPDDNDPYDPVDERQLADEDGDGFVAAVDPDDGDANEPLDLRDQDGDGVIAEVDPDDNDRNTPVDHSPIDDLDGDGVPDSLEPTICFIQSDGGSLGQLDGTCDGDDYTPPGQDANTSSRIGQGPQYAPRGSVGSDRQEASSRMGKGGSS